MTVRKPLFASNMTAEQKFSRIEKVVDRLTRRERKTASAMVTPYPISNCFTGDIGGPVIKYMFVAKGLITKGQIEFNVKPKEGVRVTVAVKNDLGTTERSYNLTKKTTLVEPNMSVFSGDKLVVSAELLDAEKEKDKEGTMLLNEVWCSFLWLPDVKETEIKQMLLDEVYEDTLED